MTPSNSQNTQNHIQVTPDTIYLPENFSECPIIDLIKLISRMISSVIYINDSKMADLDSNQSEEYPNNESNNTRSGNIKLTRFHSKVPPNISVYDYLIRLTKFSGLDQTVLLTSLYYVDVLSTAYPNFNINSLTVHRFLLAATTVACKGLRDIFYNNDHYAKVGGVLTNELNILESEFLDKIHYRILPRDLNITLIKEEQRLKKFAVFPTQLDCPPSKVNSGYNVLTTYYQRMVALVGNYFNIINSNTNSHLAPNTTFSQQNVNYKINQTFKSSYIIKSQDGENGTKSIEFSDWCTDKATVTPETNSANNNLSKGSVCEEQKVVFKNTTEGNGVTPKNQNTPSIAQNKKRSLNATFPSKKLYTYSMNNNDATGSTDSNKQSERDN